MMKTKTRPTGKWGGLEGQNFEQTPSSLRRFHTQPGTMAGWQVDRFCSVIPQWRRSNG